MPTPMTQMARVTGIVAPAQRPAVTERVTVMKMLTVRDLLSVEVTIAYGAEIQTLFGMIVVKIRLPLQLRLKVMNFGWLYDMPFG